MRKLVIVYLVLVLGASVTYAFQNGKNPDDKQKGMPIIMMVKTLDLTKEQEIKFRDVIKEERIQRQTVMEEARKEMDKVHEQMKWISDRTVKKLTAVLDETQLEDFKELRAAMSKRGHMDHMK